MKPDTFPLQLLLATFSGWVNRQQAEAIDYLREENRVLKEQLRGKRLRLTDDQRRRLAAKGKALGRRLLGDHRENKLRSCNDRRAILSNTIRVGRERPAAGHVNVLEAGLRHNQNVKIFHCGSRLQYGRIQYNPVPESHPRNPVTPYAVNKNAAEQYYRYCHDVHGLRTVCFRVANPYGPRSQMRHSQYSMVNWFLRQATEDKTITVYGDGKQVRDYIFIDDLVEAFLAAAASGKTDGRV